MDNEPINRRADPLPDTQVPDTQEEFENQSQINANSATDAAILASLNRKRTFDLYQDLDIQAARRSQTQFDQIQAVSLQALQNAVTTADMVAKAAVKHADVAADALWTDELSPVMRGAAANVAAGAVPANRATDTATAGVAATVPASADVRIIDTVGQLVTQVAALAALIQQMVAANKPAAA